MIYYENNVDITFFIKRQAISSFGILFLNIMNLLIIIAKIKSWKASIASKYNKLID